MEEQVFKPSFGLAGLERPVCVRLRLQPEVLFPRSEAVDVDGCFDVAVGGFHLSKLDSDAPMFVCGHAQPRWSTFEFPRGLDGP